jgi:curved DNA-binding protein
MDYYSILGVNRNATPEEIKKAYRKQAMQHHPDRGGDQEQFKRITEAYDILSSSDKKAAYDNPGPQFNFNSQHFNGQHSPFGGNPFDHMFGQGFAQQRQTPRNRDITLQASIDFKDILTGKSLIIQYQLSTGRLETVTVDVPAGAKHGDTVRYQGLGDEGHPKYPRGDLHIKIKVDKIKGWDRDQDNLITKKVINVFDFLLGGVIIIETLDNKSLELKITQGTKPGTVFNIAGYGVPNLQTGKRGNLYVTVDADVPKITDSDLLNRIQQLNQEIKDL